MPILQRKVTKKLARRNRYQLVWSSDSWTPINRVLLVEAKFSLPNEHDIVMKAVESIKFLSLAEPLNLTVVQEGQAGYCTHFTKIAVLLQK